MPLRYSRPNTQALPERKSLQHVFPQAPEDPESEAPCADEPSDEAQGKSEGEVALHPSAPCGSMARRTKAH